VKGIDMDIWNCGKLNKKEEAERSKEAGSRKEEGGRKQKRESRKKEAGREEGGPILSV
jgi:hypothetical protein